MSNYILHPNLEKTKWRHPASYFGHDPIGDYLIYSQNRDSSLLEEVNFSGIKLDLTALESSLSEELESKDDLPFIYVFSAAHLGVGWVEYLILRKESPLILKEKAESILSTLVECAVYNEDAFLDAECAAVYLMWKQGSYKDRSFWHYRSNCKNSLFCIRQDKFPDDPDGNLFNYMRECV